MKKAFAFAAVIAGLLIAGQMVNPNNPVPPTKPVMSQAPIPNCPPECKPPTNKKLQHA